MFNANQRILDQRKHTHFTLTDDFITFFMLVTILYIVFYSSYDCS